MSWDDDFDFDDQPKQSKKPVNAIKKQVDADFFGEEDKNSKGLLPTINSRVDSGKNNSLSNRNSKRVNPYAEKLKEKNSYGYDVNDFEQQQVPIAALSNKNVKESAVKNSSLFQKKNNDSDAQGYYEQLGEEQISKPVQNKISASKTPTYQKKSLNEDQGAYDEDFEENDYGQDFQEAQQSPKKKSILQPPKKVNNVNTNTNNKKISVSNTKAPPKSNTEQLKSKQQKFSQNNLSKQNNQEKVSKTPLRRTESRQTVKSSDAKSRTGLSRTKPTTLFLPNRYVTMINKHFQEMNPDKEDTQKVAKANQKMRLMIKRLNDELNELISKNMLQMKARKTEKQETADDRLKILQNERKNNQAAIDRMDYQTGKLQGREGQLKQQQFYMMVQRSIEQVQNNIKETEKNITKLKLEVNNGGKKLSRKQQQKKNAQQLHHLNINLIQIKKDDEKGQEKIKRLDEKMEELSKKCAEIQDELRGKLNEAKSKGVRLQGNEQLLKRFEQTKKRRQTARTHAQKLENLIKTKAQMLEHQKQQIKISIHNSQSEIKNVHSSIVHSQSQSAKAVERAKQNPKTPASLLSALEIILKSLEMNNQFDPAYQFQSVKPPVINSVKLSKNSQRQNSEKLQQIKQQSQPKDHKNVIPSLPAKQKQVNETKQKKIDEVNMQKPSLLKKKVKQDDLSLTGKRNQTYGRIWKQEQEAEHDEQTTQKANAEVTIVPNEQKQENKKKPFTLKRNKNPDTKPVNEDRVQTPAQTKIKQEKQETKQTKQNNQTKQPKQNDQPIVAPRMMKFKRKNQEVVQQKQQEKPAAIQIKEEIKQAQTSDDQPIIAPKRFNLRNRNAVEKTDDYAPTVTDKKQQPIMATKNQEYKPNMNFKEDIQKTVKQDDEKPTISLRLKDRKLNRPQVNKDDQGYKPPSIGIQKSNPNPYAPKQQVKTSPTQQIKNPYNPLVGGQQGAAPRKREGPLKKAKQQTNQPKQKLNLFEEAEDLGGVNQFVEPAKKTNIANNEQNLNLNDMLGIKKNKGRDSMQDLLAGNNNINQKKDKKKPDDFFLDL